jgi:hypothetical protein
MWLAGSGNYRFDMSHTRANELLAEAEYCRRLAHEVDASTMCILIELAEE